MKRSILILSLDEIRQQFACNARQSAKLVAPEILTPDLLDILLARGKQLKPERLLEGDTWRHSSADEPNLLCESGEFVDRHLPQYAQGPFALSIATERSEQDTHYHRQHIEIYFSEHPLGATYRLLDEADERTVDLPSGGLIVFGPQVVHRMRLGGLTLVIELPAVTGDKVTL